MVLLAPEGEESACPVAGGEAGAGDLGLAVDEGRDAFVVAAQGVALVFHVEDGAVLRRDLRGAAGVAHRGRIVWGRGDAKGDEVFLERSDSHG